MRIVNRSFTYQSKIKVSSDDLILARQGRKKCTIRVGSLHVASRQMYLTDGKENLRIRVTDVDNSRLYEDLTDKDALDEGLTSLEELDKDLHRYYGKIDPLQPMTVIHFSVEE